MTLPNQLTLLRLLITVIFVVSWGISSAWGVTIAALAFVAAVLTDYLDGVLARRLKCETDFGRLLDPLADKVLIAAALVSLVASSDIPAWAAIALISRDFLITGLRQLALSHGTILSADPAGKIKTAGQMIMILFFLIREAAEQWLPSQVGPTSLVLPGQILLGLSLILSLYSGWNYTRKHWSVVVRSA